MCVVISSTTWFERYFILRKIHGDSLLLQIYVVLHVTYSLFCRILIKIEFIWRDFRNILQYKNPVGAEMFHADGWTDRYDEANIRFLQFCEGT